ncbi:MAG TPA: enoyl-CoA hydratase/isomerase family protein, partial [Tepidiformaceae bacterium]|nr:enoyl-CoA hydratase/isomerase family protein [Tepidiformaceae bacterium]
MSETVLYEVRDGVAILTFNRPESLNAMNPEMLDWMPEVTRRAADDPDVRCVVVTGAGRAFSAGGDMKGRGQARPDESPAADLVSNGGRLRRQEEMSRLLFEMAKPTIAAVNGPAFGAGFSVALAADFRVVSEQARFGTAFARVGFSGDFGGTWMLQRMVGIARAKELYMLGTTLDARQAEAMGLATKVVPHEALMDEAMAIAG